MSVKVKVNTTEALGELASAYTQRCIARAPNGTIWILYTDSLITMSLYAACSSDGGATWTEEQVTTTEDLQGWRTLALMVDSTSVPHVIYVLEGSPPVIKYKNRSGGTWGASETVYTCGGPGFINSLRAAIDSTDTIHILWGDNVTSNTSYVTGTSGSWSTPETCNSSNALRDIAINASDEPVACFDSFLSVRVGGVWSADDVFDPGDNSRNGAQLGIDSAGDYHIVRDNYWAFDYTIRYRKKEGGSWLTEQIVITSPDGEDYAQPIIVLDSSDNAYCIYQYQEATAFEETVWYNKISGNVVGSQVILDSDILQPNTYPSVYTGLYHRYPSSGVLTAKFQPIVVLLHETASANADLYFEAAQAVVVSAIKGNPNVDQLMYQHVERMD